MATMLMVPSQTQKKEQLSAKHMPPRHTSTSLNGRSRTLPAEPLDADVAAQPDSARLESGGRCPAQHSFSRYFPHMHRHTMIVELCEVDGVKLSGLMDLCDDGDMMLCKPV
ncbi:unnamed protein product [Protopolystoma xenopodis]|uniref:Uncharacterized protein n=1 Tax=Protopolystoma xenopodis TaxID=117903 RepID=A0A448X8J6_9PLAT|nr:unnamed protein product [Protopolystoma xenopodis]